MKLNSAIKTHIIMSWDIFTSLNNFLWNALIVFNIYILYFDGDSNETLARHGIDVGKMISVCVCICVCWGGGVILFLQLGCIPKFTFQQANNSFN